MVLTYLVLSMLLVVGLVWLGRRVDGGRRSVARYHKAMDVLAEITHGDPPSDTKLPPRRAPFATKVAPPVRSRGPQRPLPPRRPVGRPERDVVTRPSRGDPRGRSAPRKRFVFVDEGIRNEDRDFARPRDRDPRLFGSRGAPEGRGAIQDARVPVGRVAPWRRLARGRATLLGAAVAIVSVVAVALVAASIAGTGSPTHPARPPHIASRSAPTGTAPASPTPAPSTPLPSATTAPTAPPSTTAATTPAGGGPTLSTISPAAGSPGQTVTIEGSGLVSADSRIVALFGGQTATTRCPTQRECVATVPPAPPGPVSVPVQLRTSSGVSNALTFRYSPSAPTTPQS
jgi:hypothetical protein